MLSRDGPTIRTMTSRRRWTPPTAGHTTSGEGRRRPTTSCGRQSRLAQHDVPQRQRVGAGPPRGRRDQQHLAEVLGQRVLFFGNPVTDGYDWKVSPADAAFTPLLRSWRCVRGSMGASRNTNADMVHQFGVGTIGFIPTTLCGDRAAGRLAPGGAFVWNVGAAWPRSGRVVQPGAAACLGHCRRHKPRRTVGGAKGDQFTFLNLPTVNLVVGTPSDLAAEEHCQGELRPIQRDSRRHNAGAGPEPAGGITVTLPQR